MDQYNEERPHDALDDLTPFEYSLPGAKIVNSSRVLLEAI
jgi:hypothetical protein